MSRRFHARQNDGVASEGVEGCSFGRAWSRPNPAWYSGAHVRGRAPPPPLWGGGGLHHKSVP